MSDDLVARVERLETELALSRLVSNYCHGMDRRDMGLFLSIWADDAVYRTNTQFGDYKGKAEIERGVREVMWPAFSATHHWTMNLVTEVDGDTARSISNLSNQGVLADGSALICAATYHDTFSRIDGTWLITMREIETHHFAPLPGVDWSLPSG
jgi:gamma-hexachlorocyclohexane dehydrochlorinase